MYPGGLIFLLGLAVILGNIFAYAFPPLFYIIMNFICIPVEEQIMKDTFREEYAKYRKHVRRWLQNNQAYGKNQCDFIFELIEFFISSLRHISEMG